MAGFGGGGGGACGCMYVTESRLELPTAVLRVFNLGSKS